MTTVNDSTPITAARVLDEERMNTLPSHFGRHLLTVEDAVYAWLRELSGEYSGGYWHFYELSNGGFYMAPQCEFLKLRVDGNGYDGRMSGDAAGIVACLFALSHLSFRIPSDMLSRHFQQLLEFAAAHREASAIFAATD
jgi:hypothetical protein